MQKQPEQQHQLSYEQQQEQQQQAAKSEHVGDDERNKYFWSTTALCLQLFTFVYLMMNVFPYSGFMCMDLIIDDDGVNLQRERSGVYAGTLASSFMIGWAMTSYPLGLLGDIYGRKFVLIVTSIVGAFGSIAFGLSTSYPMALIVRFVMGLGNGTVAVSRTAISELAKGDKELEARGVGLLMSMLGYGLLISPAIGGFLSEPTRQYPDLFDLDEDDDDKFIIVHLLDTFPFLLPNLVGCVLSVFCMMFVIVTVEETLPVEKRRHWSYAGIDLFHWTRNNVLRFCRHFVLIGSTALNNNRKNGENITKTAKYDNGDDSTHFDDHDHDEWEVDMKIFDNNIHPGLVEEALSVLMMTTPTTTNTTSRASFTSIVSHHSTEGGQDPEERHRRRESLLLLLQAAINKKRFGDSSSRSVSSSLPSRKLQHRFVSAAATTDFYDTEDEEQPPSKISESLPVGETTPLIPASCSGGKMIAGGKNRSSSGSGGGGKTNKKNTSIGAILNRTNTRNYLISFWLNSLTSVCQSQTFPLFAMSQIGGLSMEEASIGMIGAISGVIYCVTQYLVFTKAMDRFGLIRTMRLGAWCTGIPVILIPFSLFLKGWMQIIFLSLVNGFLSVSFSVFSGCNTIGSNRSVDSSQRAAMNGVLGIGIALSRGIGPIFGGSLVTFGFTSGIVPPEYGGYVIYSIVALVGIASYQSSLFDPEEEVEEEEEEEER